MASTKSFKSKKHLFSILICLLCLESVACCKVQIVFRYDDYAPDFPGARLKDTESYLTWQTEQQITNLFMQYNMSYVVSIIPQIVSDYSDSKQNKVICLDQDTEKLRFIRKAALAGTVEIAQHGLSHINHSQRKNANRRYGEFLGRDYESQLRDIEKGKNILCNRCDLPNIVTFVPPWHGWDHNTAKALKETGFKILSSRRYYYSDKAEGLNIIPETTYLQGLWAIIDQNELPKTGTIVVLFHAYDFTEKKDNFGIEHLNALLHKLSLMKNVEVTTFQRLAENNEDLSTERFKASVKFTKLFDFWKKLLPKHVLPKDNMFTYYLSKDQYNSAIRYLTALSSIILAAIITAGIFLGLLIRRLVAAKWHVWLNILSVAAILLAMAAEGNLLYKGYHMTAIKIIPAFLAAGLLVSGLIKKTKKILPI